MISVNYWAVVASAVIMMVLGALWYGPLFGKEWTKLMGIKMPEKITDAVRRQMIRGYGLTALGALVTSYVLALALIYVSALASVYGVAAGLRVGFAAWVGFVAPLTLGTVLWEQKPWRLWSINAGYYLAGLLIIGVVLALWQ